MKKNSSKIIVLIVSILLSISVIETNAQCQYLNVDKHHDIDEIGDVDEISDLQDSLVTHFPNICKKVIIGTSVSGYDIVALKFSDNVNIDEPEPEVLLTFCIHGDEDNPEQVAMKLARSLCLDYNSDPQITDLINNREIWIIAVMNPDGLRGINWWNRPNANGVNLNRNYGYMWNAEDFDPNEYSEPETKAARDFILSRNFNIMIDYHSGLQGIIYPWYYKGADSPDKIEIEYLANQYDVVSGYPEDDFAVTAGFDLYPTNGALVEFCYGSLGIYAFSVELMNFTFPIWDACELLTINKPSIYMMFQKAGEGIEGIVTDANSGAPLNAKIEVQERIPSYAGISNGDYHRYLKAGIYDVTVSATGYVPQTTTITVSNGTSTTTDFQLTQNSIFSAQKILTCRNYDNYNDPAETWNTLGNSDGNYYAIGDTGYVVLDMEAPIVDVSGNDVTIHGSASGTGNAFEAFYSSTIDGPWTSLGTGFATTSFDINGAANARYIRIEDNGNGAGNVLGSGFHLDAVTAGAVSTDVNELTIKETINVYPNPTIGVVYFEGLETLDVKSIKVFNSSGVLIKGSNHTRSIDLSSFPSGIYFIQFYSQNRISTHKIIKR